MSVVNEAVSRAGLRRVTAAFVNPDRQRMGTNRVGFGPLLHSPGMRWIHGRLSVGS
jgi:hypothetical protein